MNVITYFSLRHHPHHWERLGLALERGLPGSFDSSVTGDPCVVWDEEFKCYRMFYFAQRHENGREFNSNAHAIAASEQPIPRGWQKRGPITYSNPEMLLGDAHKPWIMLDPFRPNMPATINGQYWLFTPVWHGSTKRIQAATSSSLNGPWQVKPQPVIEPGAGDAFDGYHTDTVTAYWFADRGEILIFYKGYPMQPQADQPHSPYGSSSAVAVLRPDERQAQKCGRVISSGMHPAHWLTGWVGGLQIFPSEAGGWYGLLNGSPTPPASIAEEPDIREPAPSLGGWAYTPEAWPVSGWRADDLPIETLDEIPLEARQNGEGVNLWRHHGLVTREGQMYLLYNTGPYGQERLFARHASQAGFIHINRQQE